jgi:hypothetical protein
MHTPPKSRITAALAPLGGVAFAVLSVAGDQVIGNVPDGDTAPGTLVAFYQAHHAHVALGARLYTLAAVCFAVFGVAVYTRIRSATTTAVAAAVLVGVAVATAGQAFDAAVYTMLGGIGGKPGLTPDALQALHVWGSEFNTGVGPAILLAAVAVAGIANRAIPRWLTWPGLLIGVVSLLPPPTGYTASLVFLAWAAVTGITLTLTADGPELGPAHAAALPAPAHTR